MKISNTGSSKQTVIVETVDGQKVTVSIRPNCNVQDKSWARVVSRITSMIVVEGAIPVVVPKAPVAEVKVESKPAEVKFEYKPVEVPKETEVKRPITKPMDIFDDYDKVESHAEKKHEFQKPSISSKKTSKKK